MRVLVTGGLGYIGAHVCVSLLAAGYEQVVALDDLSNTVKIVADRIRHIARSDLVFVEGDVKNTSLIERILCEQRINAVLHLAGSKAVGESLEDPLKYYSNNLSGLLSLLNGMTSARVKTLVFSSSATVYGAPASVPIKEDFPRSATNPYARTKLIQEDMLDDLAVSDSAWRILSLRYFNPVGAHESGLIGEDPKGIPNNLMPYLLQVAIGRRPLLEIFGGDYPTPDGSCIRDFIHVVDLAEGHTAALKYLQTHNGHRAINLGTGRGVSVLEMCESFEQITKLKILRRIVARRPGDIAACWADPSCARDLLGWRAHRDLQDMCVDAWNWQSQNPNGYVG